MFEGWDGFYLLIGGAAGALIGLVFVVVTLTSGMDRSSALRGSSIYMTPTVFHFGVVLVIGAVALAPSLSAPAVGTLIAVAALAGLAHAVTATVRITSRKTPEPPHWSDVWWYGVGPTAAYVGLGAVAASAWISPADTPHATAFVLLILLVIAIRNAWDLVTWLAPRRDGA
jgi:hypothetical protein